MLANPPPPPMTTTTSDWMPFHHHPLLHLEDHGNVQALYMSSVDSRSARLPGNVVVVAMPMPRRRRGSRTSSLRIFCPLPLATRRRSKNPKLKKTRMGRRRTGNMAEVHGANQKAFPSPPFCTRTISPRHGSLLSHHCHPSNTRLIKRKRKPITSLSISQLYSQRFSLPARTSCIHHSAAFLNPRRVHRHVHPPRSGARTIRSRCSRPLVWSCAFRS